MKIQCDVCNKMEACVFCPADEAALCKKCDGSIHEANKLAGKHARFSLHYSKHFPLCDICQERRAYLFCQQDRAILCRECDLPIHTANEHTQNHNRFLLTGVKLSASSLDPAPSSSTTTTTTKVEDNMASDTASVSTSTFSEYLIQSIPGYCFEDLLDASFPPNGFCKNNNINVAHSPSTSITSIYHHFPLCFCNSNQGNSKTQHCQMETLSMYSSSNLSFLD